MINSILISFKNVFQFLHLRPNLPLLKPPPTPPNFLTGVGALANKLVDFD